MSKVMLIDGNSLTYRAFFALPTDMATASGQVTNAVFGFTSMLINLLKDHQPDLVGVAFDRREPTFRHKALPSYKANRDATPDILIQQMGLVRQMLDRLGISSMDVVGFEADDVIATLATEGRDRGDDVIVVTGDRDSYQLVEDPHVRVLYNKRGVSDYALYDEDGIKERTGVVPSEYVQYAAMRGDPSDNLPGVPGVGEKTAAKLINERGGIDGIYASLDQLTPKLRENLAANEENVRNNVDLMTLVRDVDLPLGIPDLEFGDVDAEAVRELFGFLEFRNLFSRLAAVMPALGADDHAEADGGATILEAEVTIAETVDEAVACIEACRSRGDGPISMAICEQTGSDGLVVVTDSAMAGTTFVPERFLTDGGFVTELSRLVGAKKPGVALHGSKRFVRHMIDLGIDVTGLVFDTTLAAYLLDPAGRSYEISDLLARYTDFEMPESGAPSGQLDFESDTEPGYLLAAREALAVDRLVVPMRNSMESLGLLQLHDDLEIPLVRVLARMEHIGIGVDREALTQIRDVLNSSASEFRDAVVSDAGHEFNVNSTKQLREVLFDELGLTPHKKTKTGFSTDAQTLEKLRGEHPIIEHLIAYREVEKLRSTYGEGLLAEVGPGDRIRATFNQTVARTGRLSSDAPNLHNIPIRSDRGRVFRSAFIAPSGSRLVVADYDQIELRCIAHLSGDPGLVRAFEAGDDIHTTVAARVFDVDPSEVDHHMRSKAKMVSYGLAYGMEAYGLAQRLNIATSEASEILESYFAAFPSVRDYMDHTVDEARARGYTETLFGRRRNIPELASPNRQIRQAGERQAMNAGIQGLAADIFKVALIELDSQLASAELRSRIVLQVHDEILVEAPIDEVDSATDLVRSTMTGAYQLCVPLEVDLQVGQTWADAKA